MHLYGCCGRDLFSILCPKSLNVPKVVTNENNKLLANAETLNTQISEIKSKLGEAEAGFKKTRAPPNFPFCS